MQGLVKVWGLGQVGAFSLGDGVPIALTPYRRSPHDVQIVSTWHLYVT